MIFKQGKMFIVHIFDFSQLFIKVHTQETVMKAV